MESAPLRHRHHSPHIRRLNRSRLGRVLLQSKMCPCSVMVLKITGQGSTQGGFIEHHDMVDTLAPNGTNHPLYIGSLPRRARCRQNFADAQVSYLFSEIVAEDSIVVAQQVARTLVKGKCLPQLLSSPFRCWVGSHMEMKDATAVMGQYQEQVKDLETKRGHRKEVDGHQLLDMIFQEGAPSLRRRLAAAHHVLAYAGLPEVDAEFGQLALDARRTPRGFSRHILRIRLRTSWASVGLPGRPRRIFHAQKRPKPLRCQARTVSG